MLTKIDTQLEEYDARVGNSLQMISLDQQGRIPVKDLETALAVIKHRPDEDVVQNVIEKLDVDKDGYVELEHVLGLGGSGQLGVGDVVRERAEPGLDARGLQQEVREAVPGAGPQRPLVDDVRPGGERRGVPCKLLRRRRHDNEYFHWRPRNWV